LAVVDQLVVFRELLPCWTVLGAGTYLDTLSGHDGCLLLVVLVEWAVLALAEVCMEVGVLLLAGFVLGSTWREGSGVGTGYHLEGVLVWRQGVLFF
jgi:hypothetical protein